MSPMETCGTSSDRVVAILLMQGWGRIRWQSGECRKRKGADKIGSDPARLVTCNSAGRKRSGPRLPPAAESQLHLH